MDSRMRMTLIHYTYDAWSVISLLKGVCEDIGVVKLSRTLLTEPDAELFIHGWEYSRMKPPKNGKTENINVLNVKSSKTYIER